MTLQERLDIYDTYYRFATTKFSFNFDPRKVAIRNEALRTGNAELYSAFLQEHYPDRLTEEMERFELSRSHLKQLTGQQAAEIFERYGVNNLQADVTWTDPDCIFIPQVLSEDDLSYAVEEEEGYILWNVDPYWVEDRRVVWLDLSELEGRAIEKDSGD